MNIKRKTVAAVCGLAAAAAALVAGPQLASAAPSPPDVPANIAVPAGNVLSGAGQARGFQIYSCQPQGSGHSWTLLQPMAVLLENGHKPFALHFGGPTWLAMDASSVVASRVDGAPAPTPGAVPWLLLKATPSGGPEGGTFADTTFIQRVNTAGGIAPATGCDAAHVGAQAPVYYTADYFFYRAS
ncbi:MAG: DUF3455 domain-containing protein [Acidimicrobiales bacterium]